MKAVPAWQTTSSAEPPAPAQCRARRGPWLAWDTWASRVARAAVLCTAALGSAAAQAQPRDAANAACAGASAPDLVLALRARDAARAGTLLRCRRDLAYAGEVRAQVAGLFRRVDYEGRRAFLEDLRRQGWRFVADFKPEFPSEWRSYGESPLRSALLGANAAAAAFLAQGADAGELAAYPAVLPVVLRSPPVRDQDGLKDLAEAVRVLVAAGLPVDFGENEAYRSALRHWMQAEFRTQQNAVGAGHLSRNWERLFSGAVPPGDAPYWKAMADRVAPRAAAAKLAALTRVGDEFARPRLEMIEAMHSTLKKRLEGPGLRQVADPGSRLGYRETEAPAGTLQDDDMVLDPDQELGAAGWTSVRGVKARLSALEALRELLKSMAQ